nr:uncharacterized protein LOC127295662 [Lolium perenne]
MVAAAVRSPPRLVLLPYAICGMLLTPAPVLLLPRLCAVRLGADCVEPSDDAIHPIPRGVAALHPAAAASRTATSPGTTTFRASSSTTSGSHGASPTRPRASRPRRTPSPARVEVQQVLADVRVMAACPQRAARAYPVRVGQGWQHPHPGRSRRAEVSGMDLDCSNLMLLQGSRTIFLNLLPSWFLISYIFRVVLSTNCI